MGCISGVSDNKWSPRLPIDLTRKVKQERRVGKCPFKVNKRADDLVCKNAISVMRARITPFACAPASLDFRFFSHGLCRSSRALPGPNE